MAGRDDGSIGRGAVIAMLAVLTLAAGGTPHAARAAGPAHGTAALPSIAPAGRAPVAVAPGRRARLHVTVRGAGAGRTPATPLRVLLSEDGRPDAGDRVIGGGRAPALRPGARRKVVLRPVVPADVATGRVLRLAVCAGAVPGRCRMLRGRTAALAGSSHEVIDAARRLGLVGVDRALAYKLKATLRRPGVPAGLRGDGGRTDLTETFALARSRLPRMPAKLRRQVRPLLLPPPARSPRRARAAAFDPCASGIRQWRNVQAGEAPVRVWWAGDAAGEAGARRIAGLIGSEVWPKLTGLMGPARSDDHKFCSGPDGRVDVYLTRLASRSDGGASQFDLSCGASPSWVLLDPRAPGGVVAHELMHVLQFAHARSKPCEQWSYLNDATATWAEDFVFPDGQSEHQYRQLLDDAQVVFGYGDGYPGWVFFKAVTQEAGSPAAVPALYARAKDSAPLAALDGALPGGLAQQWPAFARRGWNRRLDDALTQSFFSWDALRAAPPERRRVLALPPGTKEQRAPVPVTLFGLGRQYTVVDLADDRARRVTFHDPSAAGVDAGLRADAFIRTADGTWRHEDWSGAGEKAYCRDEPGEDVREVVLVHSTSTLPDPADPGRALVRTERPVVELEEACGAPGRYKVLSASIRTRTEGSQEQGICGTVGGVTVFEGASSAEHLDPENQLAADEYGPVARGRIAAPVPATWTQQLDGCTRPPPDYERVPCSTTRVVHPSPDGTWDVGFSIEADSLEAETARIDWWISHASIGFVDPDDSVCNINEFWNSFAYEEHQQVVPMSRFTGSGPVTLRHAGGPRSWDSDALGHPALLSKSWDIEITFVRVDEDGNPL